ncbi:MAG: hypothetical protein HY329_24520 [Chloroflexi bacterium]|nr:hypothetical protein [Chloroflexota bacterium]
MRTRVAASGTSKPVCPRCSAEPPAPRSTSRANSLLAPHGVSRALVPKILATLARPVLVAASAIRFRDEIMERLATIAPNDLCREVEVAVEPVPAPSLGPVEALVDGSRWVRPVGLADLVEKLPTGHASVMLTLASGDRKRLHEVTAGDPPETLARGEQRIADCLDLERVFQSELAAESVRLVAFESAVFAARADLERALDHLYPATLTDWVYSLLWTRKRRRRAVFEAAQRLQTAVAPRDETKLRISKLEDCVRFVRDRLEALRSRFFHVRDLLDRVAADTGTPPPAGIAETAPIDELMPGLLRAAELDQTADVPELLARSIRQLTYTGLAATLGVTVTPGEAVGRALAQRLAHKIEIGDAEAKAPTLGWRVADSLPCQRVVVLPPMREEFTHLLEEALASAEPTPAVVMRADSSMGASIVVYDVYHLEGSHAAHSPVPESVLPPIYRHALEDVRANGRREYHDLSDYVPALS